ncbi:right-handed parallel beta-helix repeat-containing protein [Maricaulaceae bacterium EIL42A08]|nr:right-handed parallel beta-helix repeat-containing protein [Maricaulaceae bacterium EIL42A08]
MAGLRISICILAAALLAGCGGEQTRDVSGFDRDYQQTLMEQLLDAQPGTVIEIPAGEFIIERGLSLSGVDGVTIRGAGADVTILSFAEQRQGAEGLLVSGSDDFTIENLAIEDTIGDALKITDGTNIVIRGVRVEWTNGPSTENGAYAIYPVQSENILIENSIAIGASDAGIYVGQSDTIIVRNNIAEYNVAGIEIENSRNADVYANIARHNTGGILVFDMPHLPRPGFGTRVFNNEVHENNTANFGHAGTPVAGVPAGTGILINSGDGVEIYDNLLRDNRTGHVIISSFFSSGFENLELNSDYDPYPESIWVGPNVYEGGGGNPDGLELQAMRIAMFGPTGRFPPVIWDGYVDPDKMVDGALPAEQRLCVEGVDVLNADLPNDASNARVESETFRCTLPRLSPVELEL